MQCLALFLGGNEGERRRLAGGKEWKGSPMGVKQKPHTHIITHLNGTIVVSKAHNCEFGRAVSPDLQVYTVVLVLIDSWTLGTC